MCKHSAASLNPFWSGTANSGKTSGCSCRAVPERRPGSWAAGTQELYTDTETLQGKAGVQRQHLLRLEGFAMWQQTWGTESFRVVSLHLPACKTILHLPFCLCAHTCPPSGCISWQVLVQSKAPWCS